MTYEDFLKYEPFGVEKEEKSRLLTTGLIKLTKSHRARCDLYRKMTDAIGFSEEKIKTEEDIPYLPVRLFKEMELKSTDDVFKTMTSSGTTGQRPSKIFLDRDTAQNQQKTLVKIAGDFLGESRLPMIIIDSPKVLRDRAMFSARGAGVLGFSIFARQKAYALREDMTVDTEGIKNFIAKNAGKRILLFGFTFVVWKYFYEAMKDSPDALRFDDAILVHGGGWKKLHQVSPEKFRRAMREAFGITKVSNYYGMVEQTGSIYMECEYGHLHASTYSDVIIRRPRDFSPAPTGERGIIQVLSLLPKSYPGHSLLTEDEGVVLGVDDCPCGRRGKYFSVLGRLKNAETRGCSDTYEER